MYSPKIRARFIPAHYRLGRARGRPMTQLVAEAIERYLTNEGALANEAPPDVHRHGSGAVESPPTHTLPEKRPCS